LVDHVFLALDTEIRDCVGRAECPVDEILRVNRKSSKLKEAARSEEDRGSRPGASYFVVSENEDNEPVSSLGTAFTRPTSTAFSGASSLSTPTSSSVTFLGTFASRSSIPYSQKGILRSFLFTAPPEKSNSLASIQDTGNPKMEAGKPWWDDYSLLLEEAGLLNNVCYASCYESFGFGDSPSSPPLLLRFKSLFSIA
jgi:hypothetical protein